MFLETNGCKCGLRTNSQFRRKNYSGKLKNKISNWVSFSRDIILSKFNLNELSKK